MVFLLEFLKILILKCYLHTVNESLAKSMMTISLSLNFGYNFSLIKIILSLLSYILFTKLALLNFIFYFIFFFAFVNFRQFIYFKIK